MNTSATIGTNATAIGGGLCHEESLPGNESIRNKKFIKWLRKNLAGKRIILACRWSLNAGYTVCTIVMQ